MRSYSASVAACRVAMSRQVPLWCAKSIFWQAAEQYHTSLQCEQHNNDDFDDDVVAVLVACSVVFPSVPQALQTDVLATVGTCLRNVKLRSLLSTLSAAML